MIVSIRGHEFEVGGDPEFWGWVQSGRWEPRTYDVLDKWLKPEHTLIDVGAWIGPIALYGALTAHKVVAVEPDPVARGILTQNFVSNKLDVDIRAVAVGDHEGTATIGSGLLGASTTRFNPREGGGIGPWVEGQTCEVPLTKLSTLVGDITPLFIKMDIEGGEEQVLRDLSFFRTYQPPFLLSLHPFWWNHAHEVWQSLRELAKIYPHVKDCNRLDEDIQINGGEKELFFHVD